MSAVISLPAYSPTRWRAAELPVCAARLTLDHGSLVQTAAVALHSSEVAAILAEAWGLAASQLEPLDTGMNSRTWLVHDRERRFVAKAVPADQRHRFLPGLAVAALVEADGLRAGAPVPTLDGDPWIDAGDHVIALLTFVEGEPLTGDGPAVQRLMGSTLARAHRALMGHEVPGATRFHWIDPAAPHLAIDGWVRPAILEALEAWEHLRPQSLTWGLLHTDPAPEAFLHDVATGTTALIDWDTGLVGPLMYDVASAVMYLGGPDRSSAFLDAYLEAGVLMRAEVVRALEPMLRLRWAVQADYFARRMATNDLTGISGPDDNLLGLDDARRGLGR